MNGLTSTKLEELKFPSYQAVPIVGEKSPLLVLASGQNVKSPGFANWHYRLFDT
jgi:hypothetical protein